MIVPGTGDTGALIGHKSWFRGQDFAWLLFVAVLIATAPETNYDALILLPLIGAFQIAEPRLKIFASRRGQINSIILKLLLSYLLIGFTHTFESYYASIFLIPVVSAATFLELPGVILVTAIACLAYFSFLLPVFVDYSRYQLTAEQLSLMSLRAAFYAIVAFLVYDQAKAKRDEMKRTQEAADQLAESNRNLRKAEASLRRSERLAALGQLTAGLAHELRNPLGTIKASAEMLTKTSTRQRPEVMAEMAGYIGSEVDRMNALVSHFLDFARPLQIHPTTADLKSVFDDVVKQQSELAKSRNVTVAIRGDDNISFIFDPDLLKLAISNLLQNAIQASPQGSEVELRSAQRITDVLILISDQGEGISPEHLENIFNPFFTTKPQGVGLGLAIVSKIVDEHGGKVTVFSEQGRGTRFEITLPLAQPS